MFGTDGSEKGAVEVKDEALVLDRGEQAVRDAVVARAAGYRAGTASSLAKGEVNGSNKKPWKQKGTGRARAGLKQSPVWRGGGAAFGPRPRDWSVRLNKKVARLAFRRVLSDRIADGTLVVVDDLSLPAPKTKELVKVLKALGAENALLVVKAADEALTRASANLPAVEVAVASRASTYQMMLHGKVVVARAAWEDLAARLEPAAAKETVA
ncbi:MAG: 50S ribosomal protein L4 [Kiritimatiellae bacterium]|nr:50S ribosomal protein L4 [Kiritimatiellia bacterium]